MQISYIGMQTQEVVIKPTVKVILKSDAQAIDEVMVVAYGTAKKTSFTGSAATVKSGELKKRQMSNVTKAIDGLAPGVQATTGSGQPGSSSSIYIRGMGSINASKTPLYVVDGIPYDGSIAAISPDDIENITILKDASAAALYGSRGANGVIMITTKKGVKGKTEVNFKASVGLSSRSLPRYETMDSKQYVEALYSAFYNQQIADGTPSGQAEMAALQEMASGATKIFGEKEQYNPFNYAISDLIDINTGKIRNDATLMWEDDWMDEVTRVGIVNEHNLSVSAGTEATKYLFSLSYYDHQGIAKNNSMNRITGRLNVDQTINRMLKAGINSTFSQIKYHDVPLGNERQDNSALIYSAMTFIPTVPVYDEEGKYSVNPIRDIYPNPVSLLDITDQTVSRDLFVSGYLEFRPIKDLLLKATVGFDMKDVQADQYIPTTTKKGYSMDGQASKQNAKSQMNLFNAIANYTKVFNEIHDINLMAGFEYKKSSWEGMGIVASQFPYDGSQMNNIGTSEQEKPTIGSYKGANEMASFLARLNYSLASKYILTVNLRVDGSSNFSKEHQWGAFPGVSAAWRMNEENWMKNIGWLSNLKLRVGVGQTGNAGNLTGINTYYSVSQGSFAPNGSLVNGMAISKIGNEKLKWETLTDYNFGIDFGFFNNRLSGSVDLYQRLRKDVIMSKDLMSYHEVKTIDYNSATVYRSRGIDVGIHSVNFDNKKFGWTTDLNFSYYRNHTTKRDPDFIPAVYQDYVEDWGNVYGYKTNGLIQMDKSYKHLQKSGAGAILYQDLYGYQLDENDEKMRDGEGRYIRIAGEDGILDDADMVVLANNTPIPFSINNTFRWKNWDANIYLYGSLNGWKVNDIKLQSIYGIEDITYGVNVLDEVKNRWSPANPSGTMPGVAEASSGVNPSKSDFFLEKAWYLRLDNVSVGYTFPAQCFKNKIRSVRVYAAGRNLAIFTPYKGMDPETGNGIGAYPNQASFAIGLDVKF